ncbi:unnamed protein product [Calicophoron daubneyi]|uniref:Uncharacterized protein n=1 Tax=Calicophoron daubneyi TaxID=300641 RepID=A0AAV2SZH1_CALDB
MSLCRAAWMYKDGARTLTQFFTFLLFTTCLVTTSNAFSYQSDDDIAPPPLSLSFTPSADRVRLGQPLTIRCELNAADDQTGKENVENGISMFLHCPVAPWGAFCFQNCKSACSNEAPERCPFEKQLSSVVCRAVVTPNGRVTYEYTVPSLTKEWLGILPSGKRAESGFSCKWAGVITPQVWLSQSSEPLPVRPQAVISPPPPPPKTDPVRPQITTTPKVLPPARVPQTEKPAIVTPSEVDERTAAITREILIVGAIVIVFISIMLNIFCCIRCALIRQYSKSKGPVHMQHIFCMAEEIRNARLVRQSRQLWNGTHEQWQQQKLEHCRLQQALHEGSVTGGSGIMVGHPRSMMGLESYNQSVLLGPDLIMNPSTQTAAFSDTNSNTTGGVDRCTTDARVTTMSSGSAFSLVPNPNIPWAFTTSDQRNPNVPPMIIVPGPNGLQLQPNSSQKQLASAVASFCMQQQQQLAELQQRINVQDVISSQHMGSDGMGSCMGSAGNPDPSILDQYQPSSSGISTMRQNSISREPLLSTTPQMQKGSPKNHSQSIASPANISQQQLEESLRQLPKEILLPLLLNRNQPMGSSQPHLPTMTDINRLNNSNSNPQLMHTTVPSYSLHNASISQSDSGTASGSGQLSGETNSKNLSDPKQTTVNRTGSTKRFPTSGPRGMGDAESGILPQSSASSDACKP